MLTLKEVLQAETDDLNVHLRRAFRPLTPAVEISQSPLDALTILVNLTDPVKMQGDLLDRARCRQKLRDEKWWTTCLKTVHYRQSHNIKFPDIRGCGIIRAVPLNELPDYLFSSSKLLQTNWCYSQDSKYVNKAMFLTSEFLWQGEQSHLGELLSDIDHPLWLRLINLGCYQKTRRTISKKLANIPPYLIDVKLSPNHLSQISLPDSNSSYVTLSPVASQSIQSHCYQSLEGAYRSTGIIRYSRASNMGLIAMSSGGSFRMIRSLSLVHQSKHHFLPIGSNWLNKSSVQAMKLYLSSNYWLLPANKLKVMRETLRKEIKDMVVIWLADQDMTKLSASQLTESLNDDLSRTHYASRFAYEPKLTKLIFDTISNFIQSETDRCIDASFTVACNQFLVLPNLKIMGASAMNTYFSLGLPSMMAFYGFVHAFERNVQRKDGQFKVDSFAICVHSAHIENRGLTKEVVQKFDKSISPPATNDDWQCDLRISIILQCVKPVLIEKKSLILSLPKRLARGKCSIAIADFTHIQSFQSASDAIRALPVTMGKWLTLNHVNELKGLPDVIKLLKGNRWLTPNCMGYHLLEQASEKNHSFRGYPHAFSECILGLLQLISVNKSTNQDTIFWEYQVDECFLSIVTKDKVKNDGSTSTSCL